MTPPTRTLHPLMTGAVAVVVYLLLAQPAVHHLDVHLILRAVATGDLDHYAHAGYVHLAAWVVGGLEGIGVDATPYRAMQLASAVGAGLGVAAAHHSVRVLGLDTARAVTTAALLAAVPAVVHFATVMEVQGVLLGALGLSWWAWACWLRRPGMGSAARVGLATALAATIHDGAVTLVPVVLLWAWAWGGRGNAAAVLRGAPVVLAVHLAAWWAARLALGVEGGETRAFLAATLHRERSLADVPATVWQEYLWAFLPCSGVALLAWLRPALRRAAGALTVMVLGGLVQSWLLLPGLVEHGAYLLVLAFPLALLTAQVVPGRGRPGVLVVALVCGVVQARSFDPERVPEPGFARGVEALREEGLEVDLLCAGYDEIDSLAVYGHGIVYHSLLEPRFGVLRDPRTPFGELRGHFDRLVEAAAAEDRVLVLSAGATMLLRALSPAHRRLTGEVWPRRYDSEELVREGFRGRAFRAGRD